MLPTQRALKMGDGTTGYPEAVQLRLVSSQNSPHVKHTIKARTFEITCAWT